MGDVSKGEGRTVLFVSHNLPSIKQLCNNCIYLKNGQLIANDETSLILDRYREDFNNESEKALFVLENSMLKINSILINNKTEITPNDMVEITVDFDVKIADKSLAFSANVFNNEDILLFEAFIPFANDRNSEVKRYHVKIIIPNNILNSGEHFINVHFAMNQSESILHLQKILTFRVEETFEGSGKYLRRIPGVVKPKIEYYVT